MKRRRHIEVIRYSRRVTLMESYSAVPESEAVAELPAIDVIAEEKDVNLSSAGEVSTQATKGNICKESAHRRYRLRNLLGLRR